MCLPAPGACVSAFCFFCRRPDSQKLLLRYSVNFKYQHTRPKRSGASVSHSLANLGDEDFRLPSSLHPECREPCRWPSLLSLYFCADFDHLVLESSMRFAASWPNITSCLQGSGQVRTYFRVGQRLRKALRC